MLKIRLTRVGKKNSPSYRVVVAESKKAVKRKFVEILGHYNPTTSPKTLVINGERANFWLSRGAQPSDTVNNLMANLGIVKEKVNKVYGKPTKKKDAGKVPTDNVGEEPKVETPAEPVAEESKPESPAEVAEEIKTDEIKTDEAETPAESDTTELKETPGENK